MAGPQQKENELTATWEKFRVSGDPQAYQTIYTAFVNPLFNYGKRFTQQDEIIQDAIHDVFVRVWKNRQNLNATSSIKFYLLGSLRRELLQKINRTPLNRPFEEPVLHSFNYTLSHERDIITTETEREQQNTLQHAINQLPARQKEAIFLRFYEDLSFDEISEMMGVETRSVYKLIYKALEKLQHLVVRVALIVFLLFAGIQG